MQGYHFYRPHSYEVKEALCRAMGLKRQRRMVDSIPWQKAVFDSQKNLNVGDPFLIWEHQWLQNPVVLFPDSRRLVHTIIKGKFEGKLTHFSSDYKQFSIALPKGVEFNGKQPLGIFVSIATYQERLEQVANFRRDFNIQRQLVLPPHEKKMFTINYRTGKAATDNVLEAVSKPLDELLMYLERNNNQTQNEIIRFVLGFLIYISAFKNVVHDVSYIKMPKRVQTVNKPKGIRISYAGASTGPCCHLRNLRDDVFYRGKYADFEKGTRWVPVKGRLKEVTGC